MQSNIYQVNYDCNAYKALYIPAVELISILKDNVGMGASKSLITQWKNVTGALRQNNGDAKGSTLADLTFWHHSIVFSSSAYNQFNAELCEFGEFLPVITEQGVFYVFNILKMGDDFIDEGKSEKHIIEGVQLGVKSLTFKKVEAPMIFKTQFDNCVKVFCSGSFKLMIESSKATGLTFTLVE